MAISSLDMTITALLQAYRDGSTSPAEVVDVILERCEAFRDHNIWITRLSRAQIQPYIDRLEGLTPDALPLYGIPFAIKDNIELAGVQVTAACHEFSYVPRQHAHVVSRLIEAGAIPIGKTNLDQFATGLVGVRSPQPWGACRNSFDPDYISGGSSSGSAVAVALGLVSFALGTDTAGSGRVPAAFNNIVGLKPTRGLISTRGVVPACRSLDCVSIFSLTCDDSNRIFEVAADFDPGDVYARPNMDTNRHNYGELPSRRFDFAVPREDQLAFFGNAAIAAGYQAVVDRLQALGGRCQIIDFEPFQEAARLLYEGPWVAERRVATESVNRSAMLPVIQQILATQASATADALFKAQYKLQACFQRVRPILDACDFIVIPTAGTHYRIDEVLADPVRLNSNLGYYTNFMNLLDCSAVALPAGFTDRGLPWGVTVFSRCFSDTRLLSWCNRFQQAFDLPLGACGHALPASAGSAAGVMDTVEIVVCGAHLDGLPLNWQLRERGARRVNTTKTAACYRLYALSGETVPRPALVRDDRAGKAIEVEIWRMPTRALGSFVVGIPAPLGMGRIELANGRWYTGFICESRATQSATDITETGGWRNYTKNLL